jgi:hypothetical protein
MLMVSVGAACFGAVIGWITYRTLRRRKGQAAISDIGTVVAAVGGGAISAIFGDLEVFGCYAVGLAAGFFGYLIIAKLSGQEVGTWMGDY